MVGSGLYFTLCPRNDAIIIQHNPYFQVNDLDSEVDQSFLVGLFSASFLSNSDFSTTLSHRKSIHFILLLLKFLLGFIRCVITSPICNELIDVLLP